MKAPWAERYRPKTIDECILPETIRGKMKGIIEKGETPNLLLSGNSGMGKTTVARALAHDMDCDLLIVNGSDEGRVLDTLRTKIKNFATSVSMSGKRKLVLLDEADGMPANSIQSALRAFIEEYSENCGFILTANNPSAIGDAIHSRMSHIQFIAEKEEIPAMKQAFAKRVISILKENEVVYDLKALAAYINMRFPDFRMMLNELQLYSMSRPIDAGLLTLSHTNYEDLVEALKNRKFKDILAWVMYQPVINIDKLANFLFDQRGQYEDSCIPDLVIILAEYQDRATRLADPRINCVAMLTEVCKVIKYR